MNGENRPLVTGEPVEFEKSQVEVQDFRKITHHFRGMWNIPQINEEKPKVHSM